MTLDATVELGLILRRLRGSARARGLDVDVDFEFLANLWEAQGGCCAVSGLPFTRESHPDAFVKRPFAPSLDRVDSTQGYLKGNVRLVSTIANFALNQWGDNVLRRLAHGVVATEKRIERAWFRNQRRKLRRAEMLAQSMAGAELVRQQRVIASLKRALTMGPARLEGAALAAWRTTRTGG